MCDEIKYVKPITDAQANFCLSGKYSYIFSHLRQQTEFGPGWALNVQPSDL